MNHEPAPPTGFSAPARPSRACFPADKVVALGVDRILENGGGIHCVRQQQPLA